MSSFRMSIWRATIILNVSYIIACSFLTALCSMEYGVYLFFGMVQLTAALFVYYLLPETANVPIEMVSKERSNVRTAANQHYIISSGQTGI